MRPLPILLLRAASALVPIATVPAQRPRMEPLRIAGEAAIEIDGVLDEPVWEHAPRLGPLTATEPVEGAEPEWPTDVRLAYDAHAFYVAVVCHDDPAEVRARQRDRDAFVRYDDVVELWFDTFDTQRFAFWFQITAGGSRGDALLADSGSSFNKSWDGIWYGRSRVTERGWEAELRLPFKTLSFEEGATTWGFNLRRQRVASGESARWASPRVAYRFFNLAEGGALVGLTGMEQGAGLDVIPYVKAGATRDREGDFALEEEFDAGLDLAWSPTPATRVRVTTNTDFAETEVDDRRVNLTRFPLFFPEKRDFFLEDAGLFEFGPTSGRGGGIRPFFSRTIGRSPDGEAVPILAGVKFTGRMGPWNVGVLETRVDSFETDEGEVGERSLGVVRLSRNLGDENAAGVLVTHGNPDEPGSAATYGADFRLGSTRLFGEGHSGSLWGFYVRSDNEGERDGANYGVRAQARSSSWEHTAEAYVTEQDYDPRMGFVRRTGVEHYRYQAEYTWRGGPADTFRSVELDVGPHYDQDRVGQEDRFSLPLTWLDLEFQSEDSVSVETEYFEEHLDDGFSLAGDVFVPPGDYDGVTHTLRLSTNDRRRMAGSARLEVGDFWDGDLVRWSVEPVLIPSALFTWTVEYEDVHAEFEGSDLDTQVYSTDLDFTFDPELSWRNKLQFDSQSEDLAWQSRLHWILEPGRDLFLVGLFGWDRTDRESFRRSSQDLVVKLSYTIRF